MSLATPAEDGEAIDGGQESSPGGAVCGRNPFAPIGRVIDAGADRWQQFWFTPSSLSVLTTMRVLIGAVSLAWAVSILPDLATFYFDDGLLPAPGYADHRLALFQWFESDAAVVAVVIALLTSSMLVIAGRAVRLAAPVLWLTMMTMQLGAPSALNAGDLMLRIWTTYLALFAVCTPSRFLSVPLWGRAGANGSIDWGRGPVWFVRLAQIQLTVVYPATVVAKLDGETWREGTASLYALGLVDFERFWIPGVLRENLILGNLMTWYTIVVEVSLAFMLWTRRTRWLAIAAGLSLHLGFDYTMRLGFFFPAMVIGYVAFVRPDEIERLLGRFRRPRLASSGEMPDEMPGETPDEAAPVDAAPVSSGGARSA